MDHIPDEILVQIFSFLNPRDLGACSRVSLAWREIINCNALWSRLCSLEGYSKELLSRSQSLIKNPTKSYPLIQSCSPRLTDHCLWKSQFNQYKFLENNWRSGIYTTIKTGLRADYYQDGVIVNLDTHTIEIVEIHNLKTSICIPLLYYGLRVDKILVQNELVFYVQGSHIIALKQKGDTFQKYYFYRFKVENTSCNHKINVPEKVSQKLTVNATSQYLIVQDNSRPCKLFVYVLATGELDKETNVINDRTCCITSHCTTIYCDKVYISYSLHKNHFISLYDPTENVWLLNFKSERQAYELTINRHFICAKLLTALNLKNCELHVWPHHTQEEKYTFFVDKYLPIILTDDQRIIFAYDVNIYVHSPSRNETFKLGLQGNITDMVPLMKHLIVVNNSASLQLWDWQKAQRLQIFLREKVDHMWVDDKAIVFNTQEEFNGYILAFW